MKHFFSLLFLFFTSSLLMAQVPSTLTSTIKGTIWQENKPSNGIRAGGEKAVGGILVKLLNPTSGAVVSTAMTSVADGSFTLYANAGNYIIEYVFPTEGFTLAAKRAGSDNTSNSAANASRFTDAFTITANSTVNTYGLGLVPKADKITYCTAQGVTLTNWNNSLLLPKSNVTPEPTDVYLWGAESVWHPNIGIENTGANAAPYDILVQGVMTMTFPNGQTLNANTSIPKVGTVAAATALPPYDGTSDYGGTSGKSWHDEYAFATGTYNYPGFLISTFVGTGTVPVSTESKNYVGISGGANQLTSVATYASAGVCVVYSYAAGALPVKLASFTAKAEGNAANLNWATTEESNSDRFDVERSLDGKKWKTVGSVAAKGESITNVPYSFSDNTPVNGTNLYRLKMIDLDGSFAYSRINNLRFEGLSSISIYPNPVANLLSVANTDEIAKIQIFNSNGNVVKETVKVSEPIDVTKIAGGIYSVRIIYTNGFADNRKVVIGH